MGSRPPQPAHMRQGLGLGVVDQVNVTSVVPADVNSEARVKTAEFGHANGVSGGVITTEGELVAVHVVCSGLRVAMGVLYAIVSTHASTFFNKMRKCQKRNNRRP